MHPGTEAARKALLFGALNSQSLFRFKVILFLENSYYLQLSINGNIEKITKLPSKINSKPIIVQKQLIFIDKNNKINFIN